MSSAIQQQFAKIKMLQEKEVQEQKIPQDINDIPISYELITSAWLTKILSKNHPGVEVIEHSLDKPDEGVTNRRRIFLKYNQAGIAAKLPSAIFCKASQTLESRLLLGLNGGVEGEARFYNDVRSLLDIEAPRAIFANADPESQNSIILLPDMAGEVVFCSHSTPINFQQAQNQVKQLAHLHSRFYQNQELDTVLNGYNTMEHFYQTTEAAIGFVEVSMRGFNFAKQVIPERLFNRADDFAKAHPISYLIHETLPRTFIHNDPHLKNWYIAKNDVMGMSDWQTAVKGHWSRDLAYTLVTSLTIANRREWEDSLIEHYLQEFALAGGATVPFDQAKLYYRQQMISVLPMWTATIAPKENVPEMQPQDSCLEFVSRISTAVDDLDALDSLL